MKKKSMSKHIKLGKKGEQLAFDYLMSKGYYVLEQNWRFSRAEIDIIAMDGEILVFIEVKTRSYDFYGEPASTVDQKKQRLIMDAASIYADKINHEWEVRFDIIGLIIDKKSTNLKHYKDAFFSGID